MLKTVCCCMYLLHTSYIRLGMRSWILIYILAKSFCQRPKSLLYFCSFFWTSKSSLLRRLFRPLHLCVYLLILLKRKVFTSSFFLYVPSPWSWSRKRKGHSKQKKHNYLRKQKKNRRFFKGYIKICETAAPIRNQIFL